MDPPTRASCVYTDADKALTSFDVERFSYDLMVPPDR